MTMGGKGMTMGGKGMAMGGKPGAWNMFGGKGGGWGAQQQEQMVMVPASMFKGGWDKGCGKGKKGPGSLSRSAAPEKKVRIGGLPADKTGVDLNKKLKEHMGEGCKFAEVGRKGMGVAIFGTAEEATNAIATMNGSTFDNVVIECDVWEKKKD